MSERARHEEFAAAAAAYAIGALDTEERRLFEAHLAGCPDCQAEVAAFRRVAAGVALGVEPVAPPAALKTKILTRATGQPSIERPAPAAPPRISSSWLAAAAAVLLAIAAGVYGAYQHALVVTLLQTQAAMSGQQQQLRAELVRARAEARQLSNAIDVLAAPDLVHADLTAPPDAGVATGRAFWSRSRGLMVSADRLPALGPGRIYQVWLVLPNRAPIGAGLFGVGSAGSGTMVNRLPAELDTVKNTALTWAITNEPAGGSAGPTTPILLAGSARIVN